MNSFHGYLDLHLDHYCSLTYLESLTVFLGFGPADGFEKPFGFIASIKIDLLALDMSYLTILSHVPCMFPVSDRTKSQSKKLLPL